MATRARFFAAAVAAAFAFLSLSSEFLPVRGAEEDAAAVVAASSFSSLLRSQEEERRQRPPTTPSLRVLRRDGEHSTGRTRGLTEKEEALDVSAGSPKFFDAVEVDPTPALASSRTTPQQQQRGLAKKKKNKKHSTPAPTPSPTEESWDDDEDDDEDETSSTTSEDEDDEDETEETTEETTEESEEEPAAEKNAVDAAAEEEEETTSVEETSPPSDSPTPRPATPAPTVAPTVASTPSPTKQPAKPYSSTASSSTVEGTEEGEEGEDDDPVKSEEHENKWDEGGGGVGTTETEFERGEVQEAKEAKKLGGVAIVFVVCLLIFTAQQMSDNPDGIYASICRLAITISGIVIKIALMPCRYLFGNRWLFLGGGSGGHQPISTVDYREPYRGRHGHVELS